MILALIYILLFGYIIYIDKDVLSPNKMLMFGLGLFFLDIFISQYNAYVIWNYIFLLFISFGLIILLTRGNNCNCEVDQAFGEVSYDKELLRVNAALWIISFVPVIAFYYFYNSFGGYDLYLRALSIKASAFEGKGAELMAIKIYPIINIYYYNYAMRYYKGKYFNITWLLYYTHFIIYVLMSFYMGSRGLILSHIIMLLICTHYIYKNIRYSTLIKYVVSLFFVAIIYGEIRAGFKGGVNIDVLYDLDNYAHFIGDNRIFKYGIEVMQYIYGIEYIDYQYGTTYLAAITNFIPRSMWAGKYETGAVVVSKYIYGGIYTGNYNLTPGLIAEGVINYGYILGPLTGMFIFACGIFFVNKYYVKIRKRCWMHNTSISNSKYIMIYSYSLFALIGLLYGDFANVINKALLQKIIMIYLVFFCIKILIKKEI